MSLIRHEIRISALEEMVSGLKSQLDALERRRQSTRRIDCRGFLLDALAGGPRLVEEVMQAGLSLGLRRRTIHRAARDLGVERVRATAAGGAAPGCYWRVPTRGDVGPAHTVGRVGPNPSQ